MNDPLVIVGAGQSGLQLAESLRKERFDGEILLIGDETHGPYRRPPLLKGLLLEEMKPEQFTLRDVPGLERNHITLLTGRKVTAIDRMTRRITLSDGSEQGYAKLALATGSQPHVLPIDGVDLAGVHCLRTFDDVLAISTELKAAQHVTVIGGGFIGLEMAAVARKLGKEVVVLESESRLMAKVVGPPVSEYILGLHLQNGVDVRLNTKVTSLCGSAGHVTGVMMEEGDPLATDLVVLAVGVTPNAELAEAAGMSCNNGVVVDACGRTSDPYIVASGDCTATRVRNNGRLRRLESVQNAVEQAKAAAAALMDKEKPFTDAPLFWSDQFHVKLQMVGRSADFDSVVERGDVRGKSFSFCYFKNGVLVAIESINAPQDHMAGRKLIGNLAALTITPRQAANKCYDLLGSLR
jgi:3-phenylpropionate/trans-cinnamate dioxygenase ferredoxin reductase subunit